MRYADIPDYYGDPPEAEGEEKVTAYDTLREVYIDDAYEFMGEYFEKKENRNAYAVEAASMAELIAWAKEQTSSDCGNFMAGHMYMIYEGKSGTEILRAFAAENDDFYDWLEWARENNIACGSRKGVA